MSHAVIIGCDGNVGSACAEACRAEGWTVQTQPEEDALPELAGGILIDAGKPGADGYLPATWTNYYHAVERAVRLIGEAERKGYAALALCSTPWIAVRANDPYADSKFLIEQIAQAHNRHGRCFVMVDRIGMQNSTLTGTQSRFEESVRQHEGELGERIIASLLHALERRK